jgi:hypothetical protein
MALSLPSRLRLLDVAHAPPPAITTIGVRPGLCATPSAQTRSLFRPASLVDYENGRLIRVGSHRDKQRAGSGDRAGSCRLDSSSVRRPLVSQPASRPGAQVKNISLASVRCRLNRLDRRPDGVSRPDGGLAQIRGSAIARRLDVWPR